MSVWRWRLRLAVPGMAGGELADIRRHAAGAGRLRALVRLRLLVACVERPLPRTAARPQLALAALRRAHRNCPCARSDPPLRLRYFTFTNYLRTLLITGRPVFSRAATVSKRLLTTSEKTLRRNFISSNQK